MAFIKRDNLTKEGGPLPEKSIREIEKTIHRKFPEDYKKFLKKTNGGEFEINDIEKHGIEIEGIDQEPIYIDSFFGTLEGMSGLYNWNNPDEEMFRKNAINIAYTLNHGLITYITSGKDKGIYFWDTTFDFDCSDDDGNAYFLAENFDEFLDKINLKID